MNNSNFVKYINNFMLKEYSKNYVNLFFKFIDNLCLHEQNKIYTLDSFVSTSGINKELNLSRYQIASLLANMFFNKIFNII